MYTQGQLPAFGGSSHKQQCAPGLRVSTPEGTGKQSTPAVAQKNWSKQICVDCRLETTLGRWWRIKRTIPTHASPHQLDKQHRGSRFKHGRERPNAPAIHLPQIAVPREQANKATLETYRPHPTQVRRLEMIKYQISGRLRRADLVLRLRQGQRTAGAGKYGT
eukprot:gene23814-biopygen7337